MYLSWPSLASNGLKVLSSVDTFFKLRIHIILVIISLNLCPVTRRNIFLLEKRRKLFLCTKPQANPLGPGELKVYIVLSAMR